MINACSEVEISRECGLDWLMMGFCRCRYLPVCVSCAPEKRNDGWVGVDPSDQIGTMAMTQKRRTDDPGPTCTCTTCTCTNHSHHHHSTTSISRRDSSNLHSNPRKENNGKSFFIVTRTFRSHSISTSCQHNCLFFTFTSSSSSRLVDSR